jgi:ribosomal protein L24
MNNRQSSTAEVLMTSFSKGDQVVVRFGKLQGQHGTVIESQPAKVYKVRLEDGSVHFFSWKGLEGEKKRA